jgi:hypothetical protein
MMFILPPPLCKSTYVLTFNPGKGEKLFSKEFSSKLRPCPNNVDKRKSRLSGLILLLGNCHFESNYLFLTQIKVVSVVQ